MCVEFYLVVFELSGIWLYLKCLVKDVLSLMWLILFCLEVKIELAVDLISIAPSVLGLR